MEKVFKSEPTHFIDAVNLLGKPYNCMPLRIEYITKSEPDRLIAIFKITPKQ